MHTNWEKSHLNQQVNHINLAPTLTVCKALYYYVFSQVSLFPSGCMNLAVNSIVFQHCRN